MMLGMEIHCSEQHLQISQARAIENKRMMIRSTNTGVTAFIDRDGKVLKKLPAIYLWLT